MQLLTQTSSRCPSGNPRLNVSQKECSMKREGQPREKEVRYIGLDVHKHYITVSGMNRQQEIVLRARNAEMERFKRWAAENLHSTDEVVLESSTNTWDIYDIVVP